MSDAPIAVGQLVAGRYRLVRQLGEGGMGAVWVADDMTLRSQVAIKLLHSAVLETEDGLTRFSREAQAAAKLRGPHIIQILDHGVDQGLPFIAMELLEGESLASRLARLSTLSLAQTSRIVTHVARAIGKAHEAGIVHRDLKPDNIFIVHNDDEDIVKVLDFGIAKVDHAAEPAKVSTEAGSLLGTPHYMSPEQVRGLGVDWRSDLWSLGVITFECLCGRLPFDGKSVGDVLVLICSEPLPIPSKLRDLPPSFDAWFAKATTRNVDGRFQSAKEMSEALRAVAGEGSRTPMPGESGRFSAPDARTLDAPASHPLRDFERARTVSANARGVGTMGGAASAIQPPRGRRSLPLMIGGVVAAGVLIAAAVVGLNRSPRASSGVSSEPVMQASFAPVVVTLPSITPASTPVAPSANASAVASAVPTSSAGAAHTARPAHSAGKGAPVLKSDELTF